MSLSPPNSAFWQQMLAFFEHHPTDDQQKLICMLEDFLRSKDHNPIFLLKGYAGTGKTSVLGAFVKTLSHFKLKSR